MLVTIVGKRTATKLFRPRGRSIGPACDRSRAELMGLPRYGFPVLVALGGDRAAAEWARCAGRSIGAAGQRPRAERVRRTRARLARRINRQNGDWCQQCGQNTQDGSGGSVHRGTPASHEEGSSFAGKPTLKEMHDTYDGGIWQFDCRGSA